MSKRFGIEQATQLHGALVHMRRTGGGLKGLQQDLEAAERLNGTTRAVASGKTVSGKLTSSKPKPRMQAPIKKSWTDLHKQAHECH
jgi:hypothetical protein